MKWGQKGASILHIFIISINGGSNDAGGRRRNANKFKYSSDFIIARFLGYVINYKRDHGDWEEIHIDSKTDTYTLHNLWCGTKYQLYMTAYNKIGTGLPCDIVIAYTKGSGT